MRDTYTVEYYFATKGMKDYYMLQLGWAWMDMVMKPGIRVYVLYDSVNMKSPEYKKSSLAVAHGWCAENG